MKWIVTRILNLSGVTLLLFAASCATVKIEKPVESYQPVVVRAKPSMVGLTAEAKLSDIQEELNRVFTGLVYEDNGIEESNGVNMMVKAWKEGKIQLTMQDNILIYRVPLKLWIKAGYKTTKFGITLSDYMEFNGALAMMFRTAVTLNPNWSVSTKTETTGYEWIKEPKIKVAGINVPVRYVADRVIQKNTGTLNKNIDDVFREYFDLWPYANEVWQIMNQPLLLDEEYRAWLSVEHSGFYASPITVKNGVVSVRMGMKSVIEAALGEKPVVKPTGPLPGLVISENIDNKMIINASVDIPFSEMNHQAGRFLTGQTFSQGGKKVKIEEMNFYGSKGKMVAEARLSGSFRGTVYFKGVPAFNPQDSTLYLKDFDFDVATRNILVKSATWLYQGGFRNMIAKQMKWPMAEDIRMMFGESNKMLRNYELVEGINMKGVLERLTVDEILLTPEGLKPFISAEGVISIQIKSLKMMY